MKEPRDLPLPKGAKTFEQLETEVAEKIKQLELEEEKPNPAPEGK